MSFVENEILEIVQKESSGWWLARRNGVDGWVPENYIKEETVQIKKKPPPPPPSAVVGAKSGMQVL